MRTQTRGITTAAVVFLTTLALAASSAHASSLRQGSTGSSGEVTGALPGEVLWGYFQTNSSYLGYGDNILRLINPNGAANGNLAGAKEQTVCAMIYVFDQDQEMGECCGCPLTSAGIETFSIYKNLTSNWSIQVFFEGGDNYGGGESNAVGSLAVVAAAPNTVGCRAGGGSAGCNGGCDPTNVPGYSVTTANNLLGSITHNQETFEFAALIGKVTEVPLHDDAGGDPTNLIYLQTQCGALIGNGTGGGICNCPTE